MPGSTRDLWMRLGALEKCCTVRLTSYYTTTDAIESVLRWRATVAPRNAEGHSPIIVEAASAVEALGDAIDRAEHIRWDQSKSV